MANFFGKGGPNGGVRPSTNARMQSSVQGRPRAIGAGRNRIAGNIIWYGDFTAAVASVAAQSGGKGGANGGLGKGSPSSYKYSASFIVSIGEQVDAVYTIFNGNAIDFLVAPTSDELAKLAAIGIEPTYGNTYGATFFPGDFTQTAWSYLVSAHPDQALAYRGEALACFVNIALGTTPALPNFNFEVLWDLNSDIPALGPDANPADWVTALLTNVDYGIGFPAALLGPLTEYRAWCRATGMLISPLLESQVAANSHLGDLMVGTIADFRWSSGMLTVIPYADAPVTGNGFTYTPAVTPLYDLTVDDFLLVGDTAIDVARKDPGQVLSKIKVEYLDRSSLYNPVPIEDSDPVLMVYARRGFTDSVRTQHFFCAGSAASASAALQMRREKVLATFTFTLPAKYILPDTMDILTLTEPNLGLLRQPVRIVEITENDDLTLTFVTEEFLGVAAAPIYGRQAVLGTGRNTNVDPGSVATPTFLEPPDELAGGLEIWIALCGLDPSVWGGCNIWASSEEAGTYAMAGTLSGPSRMGVSTAPFASIAQALVGPTIDATNTLSVSLAESVGTLLSGSQADMLALNTAAYLNGEIVSYQVADLTGPNAYNLAPLVRGAFSTTIAAHAAGANFVRLDDQLFKLPFTQDRIGATVYFKFQSFNIYGGGVQDLASLGAYAYVIAGSALASPLPNITNLRATYIDRTLALNFDEISDFRPVRYEIRKGDSWLTGNTLGTVAHPPFPAYGDGTYFVAAVTEPIAGLTIYSHTPQSIAIAGTILSDNVVAVYDEVATGWAGTITGPGAIVGGQLVSTASGTPIYYEVPSGHIFDVLSNRATRLTTNWKAVGVPVGTDFLSLVDVLASADILGTINSQYVESWVEVSIAAAGNADIFAAADPFALTDAFAAGAVFGPWVKFAPGQQLGQFFKFRFVMITHDVGTQAVALVFTNTADVEDRVDHVTAHPMIAAGETFTFTPDHALTAVAFSGGPAGINTTPPGLPAVQVTWNETAGDQLVITGLTLTSVTIQILNGGLGVARTITAFFQGW